MSVYNNFRKANAFSIKEHNQRKLNNRNSYEQISKDFDEPTYLSFRLIFGQNGDIAYNDVNTTSYNDMPHPLFNNVNINSGYSAINYLQNINEPVRAELLSRFINLLNIIQYNYQWHFTGIDGLDELLSPNTKRGSRVANNTVLTINCSDTLDRRMYHIFNLYKKIAWDDEYQRWILPDMMKYFTLRIYVTDMRNFHAPHLLNGNSYDIINPSTTTIDVKKQNNLFKSVVSDVVNAGNAFASNVLNIKKQQKSGVPVYLKLMKDYAPVHEIVCKMCEIDISSFKTYTGLTTENTTEQKFSFKIKIGNYEDTLYNNSLNTTNFNNMLLNGTGRTSELNDDMVNDIMKYYGDYYNISQGFDNENETHISGTFFNSKEIDFDFANMSETERWIKRNLYVKNNNMLGHWLNNATDFGVGFSKNAIETAIDSLKMKEIAPGISYNTMTAAIAAQDIVGVIGLARKGFKDSIESYSATPSEILDSEIDTNFKILLESYAGTNVSAPEKPIQDFVQDILLHDDKYNKMLSSPQFKLFEEENGLDKYEKIIWSSFNNDDRNKSATEKKIIEFVAPSTKN